MDEPAERSTRNPEEEDAQLKQRALQLDQRAEQLNRWLGVLAIALAVLTTMITAFGLIGYNRLDRALQTATETEQKLQNATDLATSGKNTSARAHKLATAAHKQLEKAKAMVKKTEAFLTSNRKSAATFSRLVNLANGHGSEGSRPVG